MSKAQGFTFTGTGTLKRIDVTESKGRVFKTLILEVQDDKYPQMVPVKLVGRAADGTYDIGDVLTVDGVYGGREWQGKCYGEAKGMSVGTVSKGSAKPEYDGNDIPF